MTVTSKQIAEICGVSRGTVDRALNGRPGIHPDTRERILKTASQLGYRPHYIAQSLVRGRSLSIGAVVFDLRNRFFAQLLNAIEAKAREAGYFVYLTLTDKDPRTEQDCIHHLVDRQVDGIILCSVRSDREYVQALRSLSVPVVTVGNRISDAFPFIGIDDFAAMKEAGAHVLALGYENIIYVSPALAHRGKVNLYAQERRLSGIQAAVKEAGRNIGFHMIDHKNLEDALSRIDIRPRTKTVLLCSSDTYALEILNLLRRRGYEVPRDVALMGFDNIDTLKYVTPSLTTVDYPLIETGHRAVECLLSLIQGEDYQEIPPVPHRILSGESTPFTG